MTQNVHRGILSEINEIFKLLTIFTIKKINLQHVLFLSAFFTFGLGDGITAAFMMNEKGAGIEANPVARFLFMNHGFDGLMSGKIWFTLMILCIVYIVQQISFTPMYWTVNGFLMSLTAGGIMAINANLGALAGQVTAAPSTIIFNYLSLMIILIEIGSLVDGRDFEISRSHLT